MKKSRSVHVTTIHGCDGPTSVFIAGNTPSKHKIQTIKNALRKKRYQRKKQKIAASIDPAPHSLEEVVSYITERYHAAELDADSHRAREGYLALKEMLVQKYYPELLGEPLDGRMPKDIHDETAIQEYLKLCGEYLKKARNLPEDMVPMDYHLYRIKLETGGEVHIDIEYMHHFFGAGYTGGTKKEGIRVLREIYRYYGVTEEDIENETERMQTLTAVLMD